MCEPGSLPGMAQGLPSSRSRSASAVRASGPSGTVWPPSLRVWQLNAIALDVLQRSN